MERVATDPPRLLPPSRRPATKHGPSLAASRSALGIAAYSAAVSGVRLDSRIQARNPSHVMRLLRHFAARLVWAVATA